MQQHQESTIPLNEEDMHRLKKARRMNLIGCGLFGSMGLGAGWLLLVTLTDPHFRPSDGYIVAGFFFFIMSVSGILCYTSSQQEKTFSHSITAGNKMVMLTHCLERTTGGSTRNLVSYMHLTNGTLLKVKAVDKKAFLNGKPVYPFAPVDLLEIHITIPYKYILRIGKK
jgi:hypothetical protein